MTTGSPAPTEDTPTADELQEYINSASEFLSEERFNRLLELL